MEGREGKRERCKDGKAGRGEGEEAGGEVECRGRHASLALGCRTPLIITLVKNVSGSGRTILVTFVESIEEFARR